MQDFVKRDNAAFAAELEQSEQISVPPTITLNASPEKKRRQDDLDYEPIGDQLTKRSTSGSTRSSATMGIETPRDSPLNGATMGLETPQDSPLDSGSEPVDFSSTSSERIGSQEPELPPMEMMEKGGGAASVLQAFKSRDIFDEKTPGSDDDMPDIEHVEQSTAREATGA